MTGILALILLLGFSLLAFWKQYPVLFAILAGISMITVLSTPNLLGAATTHVSLTIGISLVGYAFFCIALTYKNMFTGEGVKNAG